MGQAYRERTRKKKPKKALPINHGTEWGYRKRGCRCALCKAAAKRASKASYERTKKRRGTITLAKRSRLSLDKLKRAKYFLDDGCSYKEAGETVGIGADTLARYFPGSKSQRLNMNAINQDPELRALHWEIMHIELDPDHTEVVTNYWARL